MTMKSALGLAERGCAVFPCGTNKQPLTLRGYKDATTDADVIRHWWRCWPEALIGVPTGEKFCVIDCDLQHIAAQAWYAEHCRHLPLTRKHTTRSGGRHLLFQPDSRVRCTTSKIHPHIDT